MPMNFDPERLSARFSGQGVAGGGPINGPTPSPTSSLAEAQPVPAGTQAIPAGYRRNAAGQVVPIRNPAPPAGPRPGQPGPTPAPQAGSGVPLWLQRANPGASQGQLAQMYQSYLSKNPNAPGNAGHPAGPAAGGSSTPFVPAGPAQGAQGPGAAPGQGGWGMPPTGPGQGGGVQHAGDFNDPMNMFLSAVPMMNLNMQQQIGDAMATAGFSGNRYGTSAMNTAGQIGAQNALAQNALLQKTLFDYANNQEDRALQATGLGSQVGGQLDAMAQARMMLPFQLGQYEQGRQDNFAKMAYDDFDRNRLGWLPFLSQNAMSQGNSSPGSVYTTQSAGSPGAADWISLLSNIFK